MCCTLASFLHQSALYFLGHIDDGHGGGGAQPGAGVTNYHYGNKRGHTAYRIFEPTHSHCAKGNGAPTSHILSLHCMGRFLWLSWTSRARSHLEHIGVRHCCGCQRRSMTKHLEGRVFRRARWPLLVSSFCHENAASGQANLLFARAAVLNLVL